MSEPDFPRENRNRKRNAASLRAGARLEERMKMAGNQSRVFVGAIVVAGHPALNLFYWANSAETLRAMLIEKLGPAFLAADPAPESESKPQG